MKTTIKNLGLDPGNGYVKIVTNNMAVTEPLVFSNISDTMIYNNFPFSLALNNKKLIIGNTAQASGYKCDMFVGENQEKRYNEDFYKLLFAFIIQTSGLTNIACLTIDKLVIGIPNIIYKSISKKIKTDLEKTFSLIVNDKLVEINVCNVLPVPQPLGTYSSLNHKKNDTLIVDVGYGTIDFTRIVNGNIVINSGSNFGLKTIYSNLQREIEELYPGLKINIISVSKIVNGEGFLYGGVKQNLDKKIIHLVFKNYFEMLLDEIKDKIDVIPAIESIVFTGGGASELEDLICNYINATEYKNITICKEPQLANARGYFAIAKSMASNE